MVPFTLKHRQRVPTEFFCGNVWVRIDCVSALLVCGPSLLNKHTFPMGWRYVPTPIDLIVNGGATLKCSESTCLATHESQKAVGAIKSFDKQVAWSKWWGVYTNARDRDISGPPIE